jgi:hypothetical protein
MTVSKAEEHHELKMEEHREEHREFRIELERIRMSYDFSKTSLMLLLVLFAVGGVIARFFGNSQMVTPVVLIGLLTTIVGLVLVPKLTNAELDKLKKLKK